MSKILIIDDNPKYLEDVLPMYGYEVDVAKDGVRGLQFLNENLKYCVLYHNQRQQQ